MTQNFKRSEFSCKCGCGYDEVSDELMGRMQVVRDIILEPITILSGCRCTKHNKKIGGEPNSYHLTGMACDWTIPDEAKLKRFATFMNDKWSGGFHYYESQKFIHSDVGPERRW